jgi:hypothetical protein
MEYSKVTARGKFVVTNAYSKNTGYQINNPILHLKLIEKQEQAKHKTSRRREIRKIRVKIKKQRTK